MVSTNICGIHASAFLHGLLGCHRCSKQIKNITSCLWDSNQQSPKHSPVCMSLLTSNPGLTRFYLCITHWEFILLCTWNDRVKYELDAIPWLICMQTPDNVENNYANYHNIDRQHLAIPGIFATHLNDSSNLPDYHLGTPRTPQTFAWWFVYCSAGHRNALMTCNYPHLWMACTLADNSLTIVSTWPADWSKIGKCNEPQPRKYHRLILTPPLPQSTPKLLTD